MRRILTDIVISDMGEISVDGKWESTWTDIAKDSEFEDILEEALDEVLTVGDGAFRIALQPQLSEFPIIEFISGDCVEYVTERGRLKEIIFRTVYPKKRALLFWKNIMEKIMCAPCCLKAVRKCL